MNPSLSWIDPSRFAALVEGATTDAQAQVSARAFRLPPAPKGTLTRTPTSVPQPLKAPAKAAKEAPPPPELADFVPPAAPLTERLEAFVSWLAAGLALRATFIADEHGLPVIEGKADADHIAISASFMALLRQIREATGAPKAGRVYLALDDNGVLHLVEVTTPWGRYGVGLIAEFPLRSHVLATIQRGLESAFGEGNE
ncbi:MAG: hypothetical protein AB7K71_24650 [Polyangiaceae bacterium]